MHSPDHSTKGTPSALSSATEQWPLAAGEYVVSGSLSSPSRGAFHLSLTVLVHYRSLKVLSLGGWSPQLPTNSPGFVVLRIPVGSLPGLSTGLSPSLAARSSALECRKSIVLLVLQPLCAQRHRGLGSSRFARHYYGNLMLISFRRATEMFQFTHCPPLGYVFPQRSPDITLEGLPHSDSPGSSLACSSPGTFRRSPRPSSAFSAKASTRFSVELVLSTLAFTSLLACARGGGLAS